MKGYTISSSADLVEGNFSLLIEGANTIMDFTYVIGVRNGFTPQMGTLVSMLDNMIARVEEEVISLNQNELDNLMDENANTIGALIMHLAPAETYYQVITFEQRGFNEEEKEKWQAAFYLGSEARDKFKGHDVEYYIRIFREVRRKTLKELKKRNDDWLFATPTGRADLNNYFYWFHVVEHQSSHLGQMRLLRKRLLRGKRNCPS